MENLNLKKQYYKLETPSTRAKGNENVDGTFSVLKGSTMKQYGPKESTKLKLQFAKLLETKVIQLDETGKAVFVKNYKFMNKGEAASFLMHRGGDNEQAWKEHTKHQFTHSNKSFDSSKPKRLQKKPINVQSKPKLTKMKKQQLKIKPQGGEAVEQAREVEGSFVRFAGMAQGIKVR